MRANARTATSVPQQGVALVVVLWLTVLLTVVAISHSRAVRLDLSLSQQQIHSYKARALAESALYLSILELYNDDTETRRPFNGEQFSMRLPGGEAYIQIRNTAGLVDLNHAPASTLERLFSITELPDDTRAELVDAILDWRDTDDLRHLNGAEDVDYERAGRPYGAADQDFSSIGELRYILGMTTALYNQIAPYITVYSGQGKVNPNYAPPALVDLPADQQGGKDTFLQTLSLPQDVRTSRLDSGPKSSVYHISVWAIEQSGGQAGLEVDVQTSAKGRTYAIYSWVESSIRVSSPS